MSILRQYTVKRHRCKKCRKIKRIRGRGWCHKCYPAKRPDTSKFAGYRCAMTDAELDAMIAENQATMPKGVNRQGDGSPRDRMLPGNVRRMR